MLYYIISYTKYALTCRSASTNASHAENKHMSLTAGAQRALPADDLGNHVGTSSQIASTSTSHRMVTSKRAVGDMGGDACPDDGDESSHANEFGD